MKTKKTKFIFATLQERNGEYEYSHKIVREVPASVKEIDSWVNKNIASKFYGSKPEKDAGGFYFNFGEIFVRLQTAQEISEEEFKVLNRFI